MSVEVMYFNHLYRICTELKKRSVKTEIADYFSLPPDIFCSWLHTINYVRNICAHHARLWNRELDITPKVLKFPKKHVWISKPDTVNRSRIYYFLCMLNFSCKQSAQLLLLSSDLKHYLLNTAKPYLLMQWDFHTTG